MALTKRDRRAVLLFAGALLVIGVYVVVLDPAILAYHRIRTEHRVRAARVARILIDHQKANYLTERIKDWEEKAGELTPPKPYSQQITEVSGKIVAAAQKSGVKMKNYSWTAAKPWAEEAALELALVHVDAEADWENVFKFIAELYRVEGVLSIEQMELSGDPKKGGKLTLRITLSVFVKTAAKGPSPWAS